MRRRALLAALATTSASGCAGFGSTTATREPFDDQGRSANATTIAGGTSTPPPTESSTTASSENDARTTDDTDREWSADEQPVATFGATVDVGLAYPDEVSSWNVDVWNDSDCERTFETVAATPDDRALDVSLDVPADGYYRVSLPQKTAYDVRVTVDGEERWSSAVERSDYACGEWDTNVAVHESDAEVVENVKTAVGCPVVAPIQELDATSECVADPRHAASVSYRDSAVRVDGRVATSDPCYRIVRANVTYDFPVRDLHVRLIGRAVDDEDCGSCPTEHAYELSIPAEAAVPETVVVTHVVAIDDDYESDVVARAHLRESDAN